MKHLFAVGLLIGLLATGTKAQTNINLTGTEEKSKVAFSRLDLSVTAGTTGVGVEFSTPVHKTATLRAGFAAMPKIKPVMTFSVEGRNANGNVTTFGNMANKLQDLIGYEVDDQVDMVGEPNFYNFNLLVDFHPFKNKNWYITAGVYLGPTNIAHAYNKTEEMPSLLALGIYNKIYDEWYDKMMNDEPIINMDPFGPIYLDPTSGYGKILVDKGRMGVFVGNYKDGTPYMMEPDANGMVKVRMKANSFIRPYLGFGYGGRLIKGDDRCHVSFDCGAMYWGGAPKVLTHDGVNLCKDLNNIRGQVDDYVKIVKKMHVYPVINFKISYKLF